MEALDRFRKEHSNRRCADTYDRSVLFLQVENKKPRGSHQRGLLTQNAYFWADADADAEADAEALAAFLSSFFGAAGASALDWPFTVNPACDSFTEFFAPTPFTRFSKSAQS